MQSSHEHEQEEDQTQDEGIFKRLQKWLTLKSDSTNNFVYVKPNPQE